MYISLCFRRALLGVIYVLSKRSYFVYTHPLFPFILRLFIPPHPTHLPPSSQVYTLPDILLTQHIFLASKLGITLGTSYRRCFIPSMPSFPLDSFYLSPPTNFLVLSLCKSVRSRWSARRYEINCMEYYKHRTKTNTPCPEPL